MRVTRVGSRWLFGLVGVVLVCAVAALTVFWQPLASGLRPNPVCDARRAPCEAAQPSPSAAPSAAAVSASPSASAQLAQTGGAVTALVVVGMVLVAAGVVIVGTSRRRRRRPSARHRLTPH